MARLAWAPCVLVVAVSCGGSDYSPFFGGEGGANGSAGDKSDNSGGSQMSSGGSSNTGGASSVGSGGTGMSGSGGATGNGGSTGSGGMTGAGGKGGSANAGGASGAGGSNGGGAGSNGTPDSGAAGAGGTVVIPDAGPTGCTSDANCPDTSYCKKATCAAERGTCTPKPTKCEDDAAETPVCGCNGVTYFSSCLAEMNGENLSTHAICSDAVGVRCSNVNPACVNYPNGYCAYLLAAPANCPTGVSLLPVGRCWVLPDSCPTYTNRFTSCNGGSKCSGTCDAVHAERPFYRQLGCN